MASLPEYVSLSKIYDGGHTRSQLERKDIDLPRGRVKLPEPNTLSPYEHGGVFSSLESSEMAQSYTDPSLHVIQHGQITPPTVSPISHKTTKVVNRSAHTSSNSQKSHQVCTATKAADLAATPERTLRRPPQQATVRRKKQ